MKTLLKTIQYFYILLRSKLAKEHPRFKTYPADEIEKIIEEELIEKGIRVKYFGERMLK